MMNKTMWARPNAKIEEFAANEYVAACVSGTIQCVYPGNNDEPGDNGLYTGYDGHTTFTTTYVGEVYRYERTHGICGNEAKLTFNGDTLTGYEYKNGVQQTDRPIYNIAGWSMTEGGNGDGTGTFYVTWTSHDSTKFPIWHKGRLIVDYVDTAHPNRS